MTAETPRDAAGTGPARTDDLRQHGLPDRLGGFWLSPPCRTGDGECNGMGGCACICHDEQDREAVWSAFRRGLTDGR